MNIFLTCVFIGNATIAIQELGPLEEKRDFIIVWHLAMIFAHQMCKYIGMQLYSLSSFSSFTDRCVLNSPPHLDKEAVAQLEAKLTIAMANANISEKAYSLAGLFFWHTGKLDEAKSHYKNALTKNANYIGALIGLGWLEFEANGHTTYFEKALEKSMRDIEVLWESIEQITQLHLCGLHIHRLCLGKVQSFENKGKLELP
jgi:tetratricopeptide (TPR) repeat protein